MSSQEELQLIITVDGPAASGKTSMSRELAAKLGWKWVSTGAFYRGLAYVVSQLGLDLMDEDGIARLCLSNEWEIRKGPQRTQCFFRGQDVTLEIYKEEVGTIASKISAFPKVRANLLQSQRDCITAGEGLVAEGRDCGTVVFPQAPVKVFLTARSENRAKRRVQEQGGDLGEVLEAQKIRDKQDTSRNAAPLEIPEGAFFVDTSELNLAQVVEKVEFQVRKVFKL